MRDDAVGEVAQHKIQCSIFANRQIKVSSIFLCSCCFWPTVTCVAFISLLTHAHQPVYRLLSPSKAPNPFLEILQQFFGIQNQVSATSIDPNFIFIRYCISAQYCAKQMSEICCKNIHTFLRYSNFRVGIFYFASPCSSVSV